MCCTGWLWEARSCKTRITCWHRPLSWDCSTAHMFLLVIASFLQHWLTLTCRYFGFFLLLFVLFFGSSSHLLIGKKRKRKESLFSAFCSACFWKVGLSFSSCFGISVLWSYELNRKLMKTEEKSVLFLSPGYLRHSGILEDHRWWSHKLGKYSAVLQVVSWHPPPGRQCSSRKACCCFSLQLQPAACAEASMLVHTGSQAGNQLPHFSKLCGAVFQMVPEVLGWCCRFSPTSLFSWTCPVSLTRSPLWFLELTECQCRMCPASH